ncbi:universal stress protein [Desertifilum sp. FACHB-1129]|uniref:UspA domain-containing protein n=2 Tax=Desertifilum tharense IPPAS B-1220 TaxID=1781255 RepID=A0A1E5QND1_9CYAN|nr:MULTISPECIES: universal stress protein [Desertifilum]MDA0210279.1 universal stress protein [Cyanobacteria bacterium FC1]MDI9640790.1 universal stress protein [Geitlerinema splendidum]MDL5051721.1 universal stress protein [Oscillatoria amoena NRMC-F 0135]MBD2310225.1 universal stress protein [Desertifilum sp. FACHB-1129]MBD2322601.1 universal stress protein [Desertifilum sp. FACHB-866]
MSFQKILAAVDDSPLSQAVFNQAVELAQIHRAALKLFHCISSELLGTPAIGSPLEPGIATGVNVGDYQVQQILIDRQIEQAKQLLQTYSRQSRDRQILAQTEYKIGLVGQSCCELAADWQADLIVIGRRGHTGLTEVLLGSVSNYVVHHAPCAVLILQAKA